MANNKNNKIFKLAILKPNK